MNLPMPESHADDDDDDDAGFPQADGDADGGYSYGGGGSSNARQSVRGRELTDLDEGASIPLVSRRQQEGGDVIFDGDEELADHGMGVSNGNGHAGADADPSKTELVPYAHRDLKPGYFTLHI